MPLPADATAHATALLDLVADEIAVKVACALGAAPDARSRALALADVAAARDLLANRTAPDIRIALDLLDRALAALGEG